MKKAIFQQGPLEIVEAWRKMTWRHVENFNPLLTGTLLENKFLRTEDFSEKQFYRFQNMFSKTDLTYIFSIRI